MPTPILGLHHVTAITADAQRNIDFYCDVLGLRLVKLTVNFDDPTSYHLYYGDGVGHPGTIMTFFAWPDATRGRVGPPQAIATSFAIPVGSVAYWIERLRGAGIDVRTGGARFGHPFLTFADPDAMPLELVETPQPGPGEPWAEGPVPVERAIRGFHSVTLAEEGYESTARLLTDLLGFSAAGEDGGRFRYEMGNPAGAGGGTIDLLCTPGRPRGRLGAGVVHHVALRVADDAAQVEWRRKIVEAGHNVSPVMDREYFHSIYFREPGGVLLELATDPPGFTVDEPVEQLGTSLRLPPWMEEHRATLENVLPKVRLPSLNRRA